jgi:hypothetical protein
MTECVENVSDDQHYSPLDADVSFTFLIPNSSIMHSLTGDLETLLKYAKQLREQVTSAQIKYGKPSQANAEYAVEWKDKLTQIERNVKRLRELESSGVFLSEDAADESIQKVRAAIDSFLALAQSQTVKGFPESSLVPVKLVSASPLH